MKHKPKRNYSRSAAAKRRRNRKGKKKYRGITKGLKKALFEEQEGNCCWCGGVMIWPTAEHGQGKQPARLATVEHLVPLNLGGTNGRKNLAMACLRCNQLRGESMTNPIKPKPSTFDKRRP